MVPRSWYLFCCRGPGASNDSGCLVFNFYFNRKVMNIFSSSTKLSSIYIMTSHYFLILLLLLRPRSCTYIQVGRAVANKARPTTDNAIFDSKVLSRTHAEIWADNGRVRAKCRVQSASDERIIWPRAWSTVQSQNRDGTIIVQLY